MAKSLRHNTGLSIKKFRDLYVIVSIKIPLMKMNAAGDLTIYILRKAVSANNNAEQNQSDFMSFIL